MRTTKTEFISTPSSNLRLKNYEINLNENKKKFLHKLKLENPERIIISDVNMNSIRNKFDCFTAFTKNEVDILLMILETKLDSSFPQTQLCINGFSKSYIFYRNNKGGGTVLYIRVGIIFKSIQVSFNSNNLENVFLEINLRKKNWLLVCCYNPHKSFPKNFLAAISKEIDSLSSR